MKIFISSVQKEFAAEAGEKESARYDKAFRSFREESTSRYPVPAPLQSGPAPVHS